MTKEPVGEEPIERERLEADVAIVGIEPAGLTCPRC
jgi:hypothetical protein